MVEWSIDAFRACDSVRSIVVAAPPGHIGDFGGHDLGVVEGGATRAQSVANALEAVGTEYVAIHDAARPLLTPELVEALVADLDAAPEAAGVIAAAPVTDTVKRGSFVNQEATKEPTSRERRLRIAPSYGVRRRRSCSALRRCERRWPPLSGRRRRRTRRCSSSGPVAPSSSTRSRWRT